MRVFVTGATGVVGRRLVPALVRAGREVTAAVRSGERAERVRAQGAAAAIVDLFDPAAVRGAVRGHQAVVNLATRIPPSSRMFLPGAWRENDRIRRAASANLVDAALAEGVERFIQESISLTYPDSGDVWIDESRPIQPARYARSVLDAERHARRFADAGGAGVVLRFAMFYGPDSSHTLDTVRFVRKGTAPTFGSASDFISSISTDDAAAAALAALEVPSGTYNVADDEPLRRREHFDSLAAALGVPPPRLPPEWIKVLFGSLAATVARSQRVSNARFGEVSGWAPRLRSAAEGWPVVVEQLRAAGG